MKVSGRSKELTHSGDLCESPVDVFSTEYWPLAVRVAHELRNRRIQFTGRRDSWSAVQAGISYSLGKLPGAWYVICVPIRFEHEARKVIEEVLARSQPKPDLLERLVVWVVIIGFLLVVGAPAIFWLFGWGLPF